MGARLLQNAKKVFFLIRSPLIFMKKRRKIYAKKPPLVFPHFFSTPSFEYIKNIFLFIIYNIPTDFHKNKIDETFRKRLILRRNVI